MSTIDDFDRRDYSRRKQSSFSNGETSRNKVKSPPRHDDEAGKAMDLARDVHSSREVSKHTMRTFSIRHWINQEVS